MDQNPDPIAPTIPTGAIPTFPPVEPVTPPATEPAPFLPMDGSDIPPAPPIVEPSGSGGEPKKKFGGGRVVATILGLLVLVGGLAAGIVLVKQQQDIRQRAKGTECSTSSDCPGGYVCKVGFCVPPTSTTAPTQTPKPPTSTPKPPTATPKPPTSTPKPPSCGYSSCSECQLDASYQTCINLGCCPQPTPTPIPTATGGGGGQKYCDRSAPNTPDCTDVLEGSACTIRPSYGGGSGSCKIIEGELGANTECQCQKGTGGGGTPTPTGGGGSTPTLTPPPGGGVTAQCLNIRAFDTNWNELSTSQLNTLKIGDKVRFSVGGNASAGSFDKAKFKINGTERPEVTGKRPGTAEFFDEYTIPSGLTTFAIGAQIHHVTLGWSL